MYTIHCKFNTILEYDLSPVVITAPQRICIYEDAHTLNTYKFLDEIQSLVVSQDKNVILDLSQVEWVTAAASVLLFATVNSSQLRTNNPNVIRCVFPKADSNKSGHRCIVKTGLSVALSAGTETRLLDLTKAGRYYQSSVNAFQMREPTLRLLTRQTELKQDQLDLLVTGVGEAMLNVGHHAYKDPASKPWEYIIDKRMESFVQKVGERWWQCAWRNEKDKSCTFIICDLGLGIANTYNHLKQSVFHHNVPSSAIVEALQLGNSKFRGLGRGNGSDDMKRPIDLGAREELLVYSNGTKYLYESGLDIPRVVNFNTGMKGTLVQWKVYPEEAS